MNYYERLKIRKQVKKSIKKHINRKLDINEILSRGTELNVVVDAYEYFMRKCNWDNIRIFNPTIQIFLLCVQFDGEVANGGISQYFSDSTGNRAIETASALHSIGAINAETILRNSFILFPNGIVPSDSEIRNACMYKMSNNIFDTIDQQIYDIDIASFCYRYIQNNKASFLN